jgi:putative SOS response-associated peptidase YedK
MCGRVVQKTPLGEIRVLFETVNSVPNTAPTYNGAPTDTLPVVRLDGEGPRTWLRCVLSDKISSASTKSCGPRSATGGALF